MISERRSIDRWYGGSMASAGLQPRANSVAIAARRSEVKGAIQLLGGTLSALAQHGEGSGDNLIEARGGAQRDQRGGIDPFVIGDLGRGKN